MDKVYLIPLFLVGVINFLPVLSVLSSDRLNRAYGLGVDDRNLVILLRHRALLFGVIGGYIIYSVFSPQQQLPAMVMAAVSMLGYLYLAWAVGGMNKELLNVAKADIVGVVLLLLAVSLRYLLR